MECLRILCFAILTSKSRFCVFTRSRAVLNDITISFDGTDHICFQSVKCLGVILDKRLTWTMHIHMISEKATKAINITRVIAKLSWSANQSLLLIAYGNLVSLGVGCAFVCPDQ